MKNKIKLFGIYLPIFIIALAFSVTFRTIACINDFDGASGYFNSSAFITPANISIILASLFLLSYLFKKNKEVKFIPNFTSISTYIPTGLIGVAEVFMAVYFLPLAKESYLYIDAYGRYSKRTATIIYLLVGVFAILSVVHFVMTALIEKHSSTRRALFGLCTVIFLALYSVHLYFDTSTAVNAPNKLIDELSYLFASLFFLYETRLSMGREKWRAYIATGFVGALLCAYSSIPSLITYFTNGVMISNNIYESVLTFALFIFITARILLTSKLTEDKMDVAVSMLSGVASEREKAVYDNELKYAPVEPESASYSTEEAESTEEEGDGTGDESSQITIDDIIEDSDEENAAVTEENPTEDDVEDSSDEKLPISEDITNTENND